LRRNEGQSLAVFYRITSGAPAPAPDQLIEALVAATLCGHVPGSIHHPQEDETEQDGGFAMVLNWPRAIWRMKLPVRDRHLAGQDECKRSGEETEHDRNTAKELKHPADTRLGQQGRSAAAGHSTEPAEELHTSGLEEQQTRRGLVSD